MQILVKVNAYLYIFEQDQHHQKLEFVNQQMLSILFENFPVQTIETK
jgi:hypothetical protein